MRQVEKITCVNAAAFVMNFSIKWLDANGEEHYSEWNSGNYPVGQNRTSPKLSEVGVPADALAVTAYVHAILGVHNTGTPMVQYADNGQVATYNVTGTTLSYSVKLLD
jgi:hypothetical protein